MQQKQEPVRVNFRMTATLSQNRIYLKMASDMVNFSPKQSENPKRLEILSNLSNKVEYIKSNAFLLAQFVKVLLLFYDKW